MENLEALKELFKHPGWQVYLDLIEEEFVVNSFRELFALDPNDPSNLATFISLKSRIDSMRDLTYFLERQISDDVQEVDDSYTKRLVAMFKRIFWRS